MSDAVRSVSSWIALAAGLFALTALGAVAVDVLSFESFIVLKVIASMIFLPSAIAGWEPGSRLIVAVGLLCILLSWLPLAGIYYSCTVLKDSL